MIDMDAREKKHLQVFGYGLAIIIAFFAIRWGLKHGFTSGKLIALGIASVLVLVTWLRLSALKPLYRVWMKGARFIGEIVNFILLSVIFYVLFGITGLILRIIGKDLLDEKIDKSAKSYWKSVRSGIFERERYTKQF